MNSKEYVALATLHAQLAAQLQQVTAERDFLRQRISEKTGEVFHDPYTRGVKRLGTGEATLAPSETRALTQSDFTFANLQFSSDSFRAIEQLFSALDTTHKGWICKEDFTRTDSFVGLAKAWENWAQLQNFFDQDKNNVIDMGEFVNGFWKWILAQPITLVGQQMTFTQAVSTLNQEINAWNIQLVKHLAAQVHAQPPRIASISASIAPTVRPFVLKTESINRLMELFAALDDKKIGRITMESFVAIPARSGFDQKVINWKQFQSNFDIDGDQTIDKREFVLGFQKWLLQQPLTLPQANTHIRDVVELIDTESNRAVLMLVELFRTQIQS